MGGLAQASAIGVFSRKGISCKKSNKKLHPLILIPYCVLSVGQRSVTN